MKPIRRLILPGFTLLGLLSLPLFWQNSHKTTPTRPKAKLPQPSSMATKEEKRSPLQPKDDMGLWQAVAEARRGIHPLTAEEASLPQNHGVSHFAWHAGQNLTARFMANGVRIAADDDESATVTFRYDGAKGSTVPEVEGARAEYQHPDGVREWFENGDAGIEHGFTLARRLENAEESGIHLDVRLEGLSAVAGADADELLLQGSDGVPRMSYAGLKAWDADGDPLEASMVPSEEGIRLAVNDQGARYPLTIDPVLTNLTQSFRPTIEGDSAANNRFGESVAMDANLVLIGSPNSSTPAGTQSGAAYLFTRRIQGWTLQARLQPPGLAMNDHFGKAVDIDLRGTRVVISSPDAAVSGVPGAGKVFVFRSSNGTWTLESTLSSQASTDTHFGDSVAIYNSILAIGSPWDDQEKGSVTIYMASGTNWNFSRKLTSPTPETTTDRRFGAAIDLYDKHLVVGAPNVGDGIGAAYLFSREGDLWVRQALPQPPSPQSPSRFGGAVSVYAGKLMVGAWNFKDAMSGSTSGAVCAYTINLSSPGNVVSGPSIIRPDPNSADSGFGTSVDISGSTAVVGACDYPRLNQDQGSAYVFTNSGATWVRRSRLELPGHAVMSSFGAQVAASEAMVLVSAPTHPHLGQASAGAVMAYSPGSGGWVSAGTLSAGNRHSGDELGAAVAIKGDTAMIGAPGAFTAAGGSSAGEVYVMNRKVETWELQQRITGGTTPTGERFGEAIDLDGDTVMVGAPEFDETRFDQGAVYFFKREDGLWNQKTRVVAPSAETNGLFGSVIALSGDTAAVGLPSSVRDWSVVQTFTRSEGQWSAADFVKLPHEEEVESFGSALALEGNTLLVGAPAALGSAMESSAHVFTRNDSGWAHLATLKAVADGGDIGLGFGSAVALSGDTALIGAPDDLELADPSRGSGRAYFFKRMGSHWAVEDTVYSGKGPHGNRFGTDVALDGDVAAIGAQANSAHPAPADNFSACIFTREDRGWERQLVHKPKYNEEPAIVPESGASVAVDGNQVLVGVADATAIHPFDGQQVGDLGQVDFIDLTPTEKVLRDQLDADLDGGISLEEWGAFHGVTKKTEKDFKAVDTDDSGMITLEEIEAAKTSRQAAQLRNSIARTALFMELDVSKDLLVTQWEIAAMYLPGTDQRVIDAFWSRAGTGDEFDLQEWIRAATLPSTATYETARQQREKRQVLALKHDDNQDGIVQFEEFLQMFPGIKNHKAKALWRTALGLPKRGPIEGEIPHANFVDTVKLPMFR